jgi:hypothetical protein
MVAMASHASGGLPYPASLGPLGLRNLGQVAFHWTLDGDCSGTQQGLVLFLGPSSCAPSPGSVAGALKRGLSGRVVSDSSRWYQREAALVFSWGEN